MRQVRFRERWRLWCVVLVVMALAGAGASPPPPPPPPPPPAGQVPPVSSLALPGACEALGPCELFSELQEHSRRIAGFSYNVKKADAALTTLARQQAASAERAQRLAVALQQLEAGLEGASNGGGNATDGGGGNGTNSGFLLLAAPVAATAAPDWEKAAARELARLGDRLTRLREQVNTSFIRTLQENGEELSELRGRVATLHVQVVDLEAAVRGDTVGRRVSAVGDSPTQQPLGTSAATPTRSTTDVIPGATNVTTESGESDSNSDEVEGVTPQCKGCNNATNATVSTEEDRNATEVMTSTATPIVTSSSIPVPLELVHSTAPTEVHTHTETPRNGEEEISNGNGNGNGNGETVDILGIELETVRTAFDTLHAQVTELQARCDSRGDELEALVANLERRVASLETTQPSSDTLATPPTSIITPNTDVLPPKSSLPSIPSEESTTVLPPLSPSPTQEVNNVIITSQVEESTVTNTSFSNSTVQNTESTVQ